MTPEQLSPLLLEFERNSSVASLKYRGVQVWPLARLSIISKLLWNEGEGPTTAPPSQQGSIGRARALRWASRGATTINIRRHIPGPLDCLVFGWDDPKVEAGTDPPFHRWLSAAYADLSHFGYRTAWIGPGANIKSPGVRSSGCVDIFLPQNSPIARAQDVTGFNVVSAAAHAAGANDVTIAAIEADFLKTLGRVADLKSAISPVLARMRPKAVFFYCWHSAPNIAMSWAAHELGISAVDVQHGKQGALNPHYTHMVFKQRSPLLPEKFSSWGAESADRINNENQPASRTWHRAIVVGHRDLAAFKSRSVAMSAEASMRLTAYRQAGKRIALVTLQPLSPPIPEAVLDAMAAGEPGIQWIVRGPLQKGVPWREQLRSRFGAVPASIDTETGNSLPLFALLAAVDSHVTAFSGTALEAAEFGVPTVFAHSFAEQVYGTLLNQGAAELAQNGPDLLKKMCNIKRIELPSEATYCVTGDHIAEAGYVACIGRA